MYIPDLWEKYCIDKNGGEHQNQENQLQAILAKYVVLHLFLIFTYLI